MAYDILIENGLIVDGTGLPGVRGDVAIKDGKIVERGRITGQADKVIDADGQVVSPGFIDIHTHYDPHWWWNPLGTSSSWHGVTTVVTGNCGLSLAPCKPEHRELVSGIFGTVEEVSRATLDAVLPWNWESFPEYMDSLEGNVGINVATLLGHSAIRVHVMGEAAGERTATDEEIRAMQDEIRKAMEAGAFGWTTSISPTHVGPSGDPVPSRYSDNRELFAFADTLAEYNTGSIELIPPHAVLGCTEEDRETLKGIALRSGRPVNWLGHSWKWFMPDLWRDEQRWMADIAREGAMLFANLTLQPFDRTVNFKRTTFFNGFHMWRDIMKLPLEERVLKLKDPDLRPTLRHAIDNVDTKPEKGQVRPPVRWDAVTIRETKLEKNKHLEGRRVIDIAKERGVHVADVMADLALEESLETNFRQQHALEEDQAVLGEMMQSPFVALGTSDSGAHINSDCNSAEPTYCIKHWVKEQGVMSLEEAVRRWTWVPANTFGMQGRGSLQEGMHADVVVFDLDKIDIGNKEIIGDVPSGETRYIQKAEGIEYTIVNGRILMDHDKPSGDLNGKVLRSSASNGKR